MLRVDAVAGKLSLSLRPSAVDGGAESPGNEDMADGAGASDGEADLDEEMAARLDEEQVRFSEWKISLVRNIGQNQKSEENLNNTRRMKQLMPAQSHEDQAAFGSVNA